MAGTTVLEPATSAVTEYVSAVIAGSCENTAVRQLSRGGKILVLNLKGLQEDCRPDPLVPNHMQGFLALCGILLTLIG